MFSTFWVRSKGPMPKLMLFLERYADEISNGILRSFLKVFC